MADKVHCIRKTLRLMPQEAKVLSDKAKANGMNEAEYIRLLILSLIHISATTGTFTSNAGKVETTSSCVFWLTGKSGYQEIISERPTADPVKAYIKVKTENIGYGELTKTDESSGVKLSGAVYGIYSDSGCTNRVQTMTTDGNGYAKSAALVAGTYYVKEITAPKGYVLSGTVHTLTVKAGQTTGISATDKEQLGAITIYKEGEVCLLYTSYPQKAKRGDSASDNSEGRRETHFVARL